MSARSLICGLVVLAATSVPARADDRFEAKAAGAQRVHRIEGLVWALTARCDAGDDVAQRQCRHVRDGRFAELASQTLLVDADADAFEVGEWNAQKKSVPLSLDACIRCLGVELDGKTWFVVGSGQAPRFENNRLKVARLHDNARAFTDQATANKWVRAVANVRVEMLVTIPAKPTWTDSGRNGISLDVIGYRVFTPCDGAMICSRPVSGAAEADKKQCITAMVSDDPPTAATEVEQLTASLIDAAMKPVVTAAHDCFGHFAVTGSAKLKITVLGDGTIGKYEQQGDFTNTNTGACIDRAMKTARFPRSKKPKTTIMFPLTLNAP